jgi:hypothetical protein
MKKRGKAIYIGQHNKGKLKKFKIYEYEISKIKLISEGLEPKINNSLCASVSTPINYAFASTTTIPANITSAINLFSLKDFEDQFVLTEPDHEKKIKKEQDEPD